MWRKAAYLLIMIFTAHQIQSNLYKFQRWVNKLQIILAAKSSSRFWWLAWKSCIINGTIWHQKPGVLCKVSNDFPSENVTTANFVRHKISLNHLKCSGIRWLRLKLRDLQSFEIRFDFESNFRFGIWFVVMIRFEIFESSTPCLLYTSDAADE